MERMSLGAADARRVLVLRALQLGDLLCAVPALRALRARCPLARITLAGLPWAAGFARRFDRYIDDFVVFPGFPGLPEQPPDIAAFPVFVRAMQVARFDLAVQMQGDGRTTNGVLLLCGATRTVGFHPIDGWCPDPQSFVPYPPGGHEIVRNLALVARLGPGPLDDTLEFPVLDEDRLELAESPDLNVLQAGAYACLHPGARHAHKRWPPERFAAVGDALAKRGLRVVVTGSAAERGIADRVVQAMRAPAMNAACDISVGGLAALLSDAAVVVSNDTGVAHLVAALGVPSVVVFFATDPARWAPLDGQRHRTLYDPAGVEARAVIEALDALLVDPTPPPSTRIRSQGQGFSSVV